MGAPGEEDGFQRPCHQCRHLITPPGSTTPRDMSNASLTTNHIAFQTTAAALAALLLTTTTTPRAASLLLHLPAGTLASWTVVVGTKPVPSASPPSPESQLLGLCGPVAKDCHALVLVLALALLFSGSPGACCCCLYSTLVFVYRYGRKGGAALSHSRCLLPPLPPPLRVVMFPTIAIIIYNSLYILCILHESCLFYFIFRSHLSVRACRRLASVSWCCALRRDSAAFCIRR